MANCSNCGAHLTPSLPTCPYCGTRNGVDLQSISDSTTEIPQEDRNCPNCECKLKTIDIGEGSHFYIESCGSCGGLFFDNGELQAILEQKVGNAVRVNHQGLDRLLREPLESTLQVVYRRCPVCGIIMNREKFGEKSGVIIDHCHAHGVWLEPGELTRLLEWKKEGGEILDAKRRYEEEQRKLKAERERYRNLNSSGGSSYNSPYTSGSFFEAPNQRFSGRGNNIAGSAIELLMDIAGWFFRNR